MNRCGGAAGRQRPTLCRDTLDLAPELNLGNQQCGTRLAVLGAVVRERFADLGGKLGGWNQ